MGGNLFPCRSGQAGSDSLSAVSGVPVLDGTDGGKNPTLGRCLCLMTWDFSATQLCLQHLVSSFVYLKKPTLACPDLRQGSVLRSSTTNPAKSFCVLSVIRHLGFFSNRILASYRQESIKIFIFLIRG